MAPTNRVPRATAPDASRERAFDALFRSYYASLCRYAARLAGSTSVGEELVQQVFADVWHRWSARGDLMPSRAYLYKAVRHDFMSMRRHENVHRRFMLAMPFRHREPLHAPSADRDVELNDLAAAVEHAVERLPPKCREIYRLSRQHDLSQQEIAETLGLSQKTVEAQMTRAFRHLRTALADFLLPGVALAIDLGRVILDRQ